MGDKSQVLMCRSTVKEGTVPMKLQEIISYKMLQLRFESL